MSRCFPFPPPGYEKKARVEEVEFLRKEKHREKKNKKERKLKEKGEGKEKSDGKHVDKKDKKHKHRKKKKDNEEWDKDRDKSSTTEEKKISHQPESYKREKFKQEDRVWDSKNSRISNEKELVHPKRSHFECSILPDETSDFQFVQDFGRRIRDEEKATVSLLVESRPCIVQKNDEGINKVEVKNNTILSERKEKMEEKKVDGRKTYCQQVGFDPKYIGNATVQDPACMVQNRVEKLPHQLEKIIQDSMEVREKFKEREGDEKRVDKNRDKHCKKKSHRKDKDGEKEKKKEDKVKKRSENKNNVQEKIRDPSRNDLGTHKVHISQDRGDGDRNTVVEENLKKRKYTEANGLLHESVSDVRPNKMPKPNSHMSRQNGRQLEPCRNSSGLSSDMQGPQNNIKADYVESKLIVLTEVPSVSISKNSSSTTLQADQIAQVLSKPPHPDSKYLSRVLSVPKIEEWPDFDDHDWLFSNKNLPLKKPDLGSSGMIPHVWAEAIEIQSADVHALPYVIPY